MKLDGRKWLDEMEKEEFWEKSKGFGSVNDKWFFWLLTFNSGADIITRYNCNQARCFLLHLV